MEATVVAGFGSEDPERAARARRKHGSSKVGADTVVVRGAIDPLDDAPSGADLENGGARSRPAEGRGEGCGEERT